MKNKFEKTEINNLNNRIIDTVYKHEKKRTYLDLLKYTFGIIFSISIIFLLTIRILNILKKQQTLDLFELFNEDSEIIKKYFFEVLITFYEELPKILSLILLILILAFILVIYFLKKNYLKLKNRLNSTFRYFKHL